MTNFEDPKREARFWKMLVFLLLAGIQHDEFRTQHYKEEAEILTEGFL